MRLLSLDLATKLGWTSGDTETGDPVSGIHQLPKGTGDDVGRFLAAYHNFLVQLIEDQKPELITFEAPVPAQSNTTISTLLKLWGLCSHTEFVCTWKRIGVRQVPVSTWKSAIVGTCRFSKPSTKAQAADYPVVRALHQLGFDHVTDDNEADALGQWIYCVRLVSPGKEARFDPLARAASFQHVA
ncbi:hypothetical protein [uncultured Hyphomicrobium sp.]|uniref:hypothetical protein n=1 Tax=uncultured Hyphomicrobium sp. TaxID=194373 RepID=UPI0025F2B84D|nr:hypothetical protein [uncultured Hyphomicrobium sp.]